MARRTCVRTAVSSSVLLAVLAIGVLAQEPYWIEAIGAGGFERVECIDIASDGSLYVAGRTTSYGAGNSDGWIAKLSKDGSITWEMALGWSGTDQLYDIAATADGGCIAAGTTWSDALGASDGWLIKLSSSGTVEWQRTYGGSGEDILYTIDTTSDGGYVVSAGTPTNQGSNNGWIAKLESNGHIEWQYTYGGDAYDNLTSVRQADDGGFIATSETLSYGAGQEDLWVVKLGASGEIEWQSCYGGAQEDYANDAIPTSDGGYLVVGASYSFAVGDKDAWFLKLDVDGAVEWEAAVGGVGEDVAREVAEVSGGFVIVGYTTSDGGGGYDGWIAKLSHDGSVVWQRTYGGGNRDSALGFCLGSGNRIAVAGETESSGSGSRDAYVLKLNEDGLVVDSCASIQTASLTANGTAATVTPTEATRVATEFEPRTVTPASEDTSFTPVRVCQGEDPVIENGDVDLDGDIDHLDARLCFAWSMGCFSGTPEQRLQADVDDDGDVDFDDANAIAEHVIGMRGTLP